MFELSTADKKSAGQRLSVWVEELTIADQAWGFMASEHEYGMVACFDVDTIHSIPQQVGFEPLRVEWEKPFIVDGDGREIPNRLPGAEGHVGIAGLNQGGNGKTHKKQRKDLRSELADAAELSPVPVPHKIAEEHIRVAAYFIYEKDTKGELSQEEH